MIKTVRSKPKAPQPEAFGGEGGGVLYIGKRRRRGGEAG